MGFLPIYPFISMLSNTEAYLETSRTYDAAFLANIAYFRKKAPS